jgi:2-amino-4-hydroxy-6-hydroxymethyldihydropteridine diphosphokinase
MHDVHVGVASNVDPEHQLRRALTELERRFGAIERSPAFRSRALGTAAADYSNMAVRFAAALSPAALVAELKGIEAALGRTRGLPSRCELDLDLLLYGRRVDAGLRLPHPDILRRPFVLQPLALLAPALPHPVTGVRMGAAWAAARASHGAQPVAVEI